MTSSCKHLRKELKGGLIERYKLICENVIYPASNEGLKRKMKTRYDITFLRKTYLAINMHRMFRVIKACWSYCTECRSRLEATLCACLQCCCFGCVKPSLGHLQTHFNQAKHIAAVSLTTGHLYCHLCQDFVYDRDCEVLRRNADNAQRRFLGLSQMFTWNPAKAEIDRLQPYEHKENAVSRISTTSTLGLRGLVNMGNTCFMNCILQALTHTPLLRDYFMSDQHRCANKTAGKCLMCEMSVLFQEFYREKSKLPAVPSRLLHMVWTNARHLAGYEQQDAHEFLIAALDVLHRHSRSSTMVTKEQDCQCIIDRIFTGKLKSDVICQSCKNVSTTEDPFWDISLDLGAIVAQDGKVDGKTLQGCLERYVCPEYLGSSAKIKCNQCQSYEESTKQLTLQKLPIVSCFHFKRFEHSTKLHKKISTYVSFPEQLDLTPYTASQHLSLSAGVPLKGLSPAMTQMVAQRNLYNLFAVVNHIGTIEGGHYICYVRQNLEGDWFKCDDHVISRASSAQVMHSEAYLLFYHKTFIEYD